MAGIYHGCVAPGAVCFPSANDPALSDKYAESKPEGLVCGGLCCFKCWLCCRLFLNVRVNIADMGYNIIPSGRILPAYQAAVYKWTFHTNFANPQERAQIEVLRDGVPVATFYKDPSEIDTSPDPGTDYIWYWDIQIVLQEVLAPLLTVGRTLIFPSLESSTIVDCVDSYGDFSVRATHIYRDLATNYLAPRS